MSIGTRTNPINCLECGVPNDGHMCVDNIEEMPAEGDLTLCVYCGHLQMFTSTEGILGYRELDEEERTEAVSMPDVIRAQEMIAYLNRNK